MRYSIVLRIQVLCIAVIGLSAPGCHLFSDPDDIDECPMGSGYPCRCDPYDNGGLCDDNSVCIPINSEEKGFCSRDCAGVQDEGICEDRQGYGAFGFCRQWFEASPGPDQCIVVCEYDNMSGECPPGLTCVPFADGDLNYSACVAVEIVKGESPSECGSFCSKLVSCEMEIDPQATLTVSQCVDACVQENWMGEYCPCLFDCDVTASCLDFSLCSAVCECV